MDEKLNKLLVRAVVAFAVCGSVAVAASRLLPHTDTSATSSHPGEAQTNFPVTIRKPLTTPRVFTGETNWRGERVTVACSTCHTTTKPNLATHSSEELDEFHQGLRFVHGGVSCLSCHNEKNYDTLHLANGAALAFEDVMNLCAQCHGPQFRDYRNGSHGGMNGYWDLKAGGRTRNNCVDCHDPHAPRYQSVMPVFKPAPAERHSKKPSSQHH